MPQPAHPGLQARRHERRQRRAGLAHLLRLDRQDDQRRVARRVGVDRGVHGHAWKPLGQRSRCAATGSTTAIDDAGRPRAIRPPMSADAMLPPPMKSVVIGSVGVEPGGGSGAAGWQRPGGSGGRHRRDRHGLAVTPGGEARAPKIAVPTRTIVAPSAIADSRSADMPIDSVSTASPASRQRRKQSASARNCERACAGVRGRLGDAHDAPQPQPGQRGDHRRQRQRLVRSHAGLGRFPADVDLDADRQRRPVRGTRRGERAGDLLAVHRLHPVEALGGELRLVALQGTDQVPFDVREAGQRFDLRDRLLHVILAEAALSGRPGRRDRRRGESLADREQRDRRRIAPGRPRRGIDALAGCLQAFLQVAHNQMTPACAAFRHANCMPRLVAAQYAAANRGL